MLGRSSYHKQGSSGLPMHSDHSTSSHSSSYDMGGPVGMYGAQTNKNKSLYANMMMRQTSKCSMVQLVGLGWIVLNVIVTMIWLGARGTYRSLLTGLNAKDAADAIRRIEAHRSDLNQARRELKMSERESQRKFGPRLEMLKRETDNLMKERDDLRNLHEGGDSSKKVQEARLKQRELAFQAVLGRLQQATRRESKRDVLERFGPGPHEVQFTFEKDGKEYDIVFQMAPLDTVPHAIHLFLEQVDHGLWNGTSFYLNTAHVIQAGPNVSREEEAANDDKYERSSVKPFADLQLDQLVFPDYSDEYPHVQWTIGYAGRPGGPDFYINKMDNVVMHGPGGQVHRTLEEQGDPCFGKIIKGLEHVERILLQQPVENNGSEFAFFYKEPINIVRAVVLTRRADPGGKIIMEIPEPMEFDFGKTLLEALAPLEMTLLTNPNITVEVEQVDEDKTSTNSNNTALDLETVKEGAKETTIEANDSLQSPS